MAKLPLEDISRQPMILGTTCLTDPSGNKGYKTEIVQASALVRIADALEQANEQKHRHAAGFTSAEYTDGLNHFHLAQLKRSRLVEMQVLGSSPEMAATFSAGIRDFLTLIIERGNLQEERAEVQRKLNASESDLCHLMYVDEAGTAEEAEELFRQITWLKERLAAIDQQLAAPDIETLRRERDEAKALLQKISAEDLKLLGDSIDLNAKLDALRWDYINSLESIASLPLGQLNDEYKEHLRATARRLRNNEKGGQANV
jgi:hypothetical protein